MNEAKYCYLTEFQSERGLVAGPRIVADNWNAAWDILDRMTRSDYCSHAKVIGRFAITTDQTDFNFTYDSFWRNIVEPNGVFDLDRVKRELHDYWNLMDRASKVYMHVTGGRISNPNTTAEAVISASDEYFDLAVKELGDDSIGPNVTGN